MSMDREGSGRRIARRLGLDERDIEEPDAVFDLGYRVATDHRIGFPRAPFKPHPVEDPPDLGREHWERYPLERDEPPATGDVLLDTDVALGLDEPLHDVKGPKSDKQRGRRDRRGTA